MEKSTNLLDSIALQKELLEKLEVEYKQFVEKDFAKENDFLSEKLSQTQRLLLEAEKNQKKLENDNIQLRNALYDKIISEKISLLDSSKTKMNLYFGTTQSAQVNKLLQFEHSVKQRIDAMTAELRANNIEMGNAIYVHLEELAKLTNQQISLARQAAAEDKERYTQAMGEHLQSLKDEPITEQMIKASTKKSNIESFVGLNLINKLGILLIVLGVIASTQYTYLLLTDTIKGMMIFVLGGVMLVVGEFLGKKKTTIFSQGMTAGGVAVLYVAVTACYFSFGILSDHSALLLCILITLGASVLSTRYNAQVILSFALIGGYLPIFSIWQNRSMIFAVMAYFVLLNFLALVISFRKKWIFSTYLGLFFNLVGSFYIYSILPAKDELLTQSIAILYNILAFVIYTLIPIISTYKQKSRFKVSDIVLIALNAFFSSSIMYAAFYMFDLQNYNGFLAAIFAVVYLLCANLMGKLFTEEKNMQALFYITGFAFTVLMIPMQFGIEWITLGWLIEGSVIWLYAIWKKERLFESIGCTITILCWLVFLYFDLFWAGELFAYKYFAITLASLLVVGAYLYQKSLVGSLQKMYLYAVVVNAWFYSMYLITNEFYALFPNAYFRSAFAIAATFALAFVIPKFKAKADNNIKIIASVQYVIGMLWLLWINAFFSPFSYAQSTTFAQLLLGTIVLWSISLLSVAAFYDFLKKIASKKGMRGETLTLLLSGYLVLMLTQNLITQYHLQLSSVILSLLYMLTAFAWILLGFVKRYTFLRRFGLLISILSVMKLFLLDFFFLSSGYRILSYFALGISLVAISFLYQQFSKRFELTAMVVQHEEDK